MSSLILETGTRAVFHTILVYSVFLLFAGHNAPGGGFIGGLVAGTALVLRFVAYGSKDLGRTVRATPELVLGAGIFTAAVAAVVPWLAGGQLLQMQLWEVAVPLIGVVKLTTVLLFDIGVYVVVVGVVLSVLVTLGGEMDS